MIKDNPEDSSFWGRRTAFKVIISSLPSNFDKLTLIAVRAITQMQARIVRNLVTLPI